MLDKLDDYGVFLLGVAVTLSVCGIAFIGIVSYFGGPT